ncbi:MAG: amino acid ABC transporter permease [Janthinobacterium lividum]
MELLELLQIAAPIMLRGAGYTLVFAVAAMFFGLLLAMLLAVARISALPLLRQAAAVYVSLMRGTPLLVQVFIIYYGLPSIGIVFSPFAAGILALSLNAGAYLSETMRGAILGIGRGQWAASHSLGMTNLQTLQHIIFPQAVRIAVPGLSNTLISLIKDTSLVSVITVTELMLATKEVIAITFRPLPLYVAAALVYWLLSVCFELLQHRLERRLNRAMDPQRGN